MLRLPLCWAAPLTLLIVLAAASPASATVTTSNVTTPSDPAFPVADINLAGNTTVSGTTDGTTGDAVDIRCYYGAASYATFANNVAVDGSGNFSKTDFTFQLEGGASPLPSCVLRAVPHGDASDQRPGSASSFTGPFIGNGSRFVSTISGSKNDGTQYDFDREQSAQRGYVDFFAASNLGINSASLWTQPLLDPSQGIWFGNAYFYFQPSFGHDRSELRVDGVDAYGPASSFYAFPEARNDPGFPTLGYSDSINTAGDLTVDDTEPMVTCSPASATYPPSSASCSSFVSAGILLHRTLTTTNSGRVIGIVDRWSSTDGKSHLLDVLYENDQESDDAGGIGAANDGAYLFPWRDSAYTGYPTGAMFSGPPAAPASFFYKTRADVAASGDDVHPFGAVSFQSTPEQFDFLRGTSDVSYSALTMRYVRTIPATGECALRFAYADDFSQASVDAFASADVAALGGATDVCPPPPPSAAGGGATTPPAVVTKPGVHVKSKRTISIRAAIKRGIPETVACDKTCAIVADLQFDARTAKRLHITKFVRAGRGRGSLTAAGKVRVVVKLTRRAKRGLLHARRARARIQTSATGAGGTTVVTSKLTLRR